VSRAESLYFLQKIVGCILAMTMLFILTALGAAQIMQGSLSLLFTLI